MKEIMMAREAIMATISRLPSAGTIDPCPVCKQGVLFFTVASNGHVHAGCNNDKKQCVSWIE
jgi:hypothetical protein